MFLNEAETRRKLIDPKLTEAGWILQDRAPRSEYLQGKISRNDREAPPAA
jgi:type I site-specific restriction endonuclease